MKGQMTFREVFEYVQEEKLRYIKDKEKRLSVQNTIGRNRSGYRRFFEGTDFENMPIGAITKRDIEGVTYTNLKRYDLGKKAFQNYKGILKSVFDLAFEEYLVRENVYDRVDFHKFSYMIVKNVPVEERTHSDEELEVMLDFIYKKLQRRPDYFPAHALRLQIIMGLRRGEVPPLMWTDFKDGYAMISKEQLTIKKNGTGAKEHFVIVNHTKTWKDRKFPITDCVAGILTDIEKIHYIKDIHSPFLFPCDNECGIITNNVVYSFYRRMCKKLDIPISRECIKGTHSFRRNAITKTVNNSGGNVFMASKLYGNTPEVVKDCYYTGLDLDEAREILER